MSTCKPCAAPEHTKGDCANAAVPMIARTCTCGCSRTEPDPAPYWTQQGEQA